MPKAACWSGTTSSSSSGFRGRRCGGTAMDSAGRRVRVKSSRKSAWCEACRCRARRIWNHDRLCQFSQRPAIYTPSFQSPRLNTPPPSCRTNPSGTRAHAPTARAHESAVSARTPPVSCASTGSTSAVNASARRPPTSVSPSTDRLFSSEEEEKPGRDEVGPPARRMSRRSSDCEHDDMAFMRRETWTLRCLPSTASCVGTYGGCSDHVLDLKFVRVDIKVWRAGGHQGTSSRKDQQTSSTPLMHALTLE
nr:hypothetical protein CFP56_02670 [Quercus suber]